MHESGGGHGGGHGGGQKRKAEDGGHGGGHGHGHGAAKKSKKKRHDLSGVGSVGLTVEGSLSMTKFEAFMGELLKNHCEDLYRSKGVVSIAEKGDAKFVFQVRV